MEFYFTANSDASYSSKSKLLNKSMYLCENAHVVNNDFTKMMHECSYFFDATQADTPIKADILQAVAICLDICLYVFNNLNN